MAKKIQKKAKKSDIALLIEFFEGKLICISCQQDGTVANKHCHWHNAPLCSTGQERLKWWKRNGKKFRSIKDAILKWDDDHLEAFLDYFGIDIYDHGDDELTEFRDKLDDVNIDFCQGDLPIDPKGWKDVGVTLKEAEKALEVVGKIADYKERFIYDDSSFSFDALRKNIKSGKLNVTFKALKGNTN